MDSKKSTAHFEIPRLSAEHNGLWECRVSTNGGQDTFKFTLTVKGEIHLKCIHSSEVLTNWTEFALSCELEPPYPSTAPKLLSRSSKQLVVKPVDTYKGDGPIISTKLLYKPVDTEDSLSSVIGNFAQIISGFRNSCIRSMPMYRIISIYYRSHTHIIFFLVYGSDQITLPNLKPSTKYQVRVQLARPGDGGEGPLGPEAIMETDCPGENQLT